MDIPRYWRLRDQRYRLQGSRCPACSTVYFPPRPVCPKCRHRPLEDRRLVPRGTVISYSVIYQTAERFEGQVPYVVAIVELEQGVRLTAQLTDLDVQEARIGLPVEMVVRKYYEQGADGPIMYGYKFRPLLQG